jgi:hypothetical protein
MPNPIASRVDDRYPSWDAAEDDDLTCREGPLASSSGSPSVAQSASPSAEARPSAARPSATGVSGPHAEAHAYDNDYYAGAFALRGRDAASGLEMEIFSASIHQGGAEHAVQVGMARIGGSTDSGHFSAKAEVFTAKAHASVEGPDGSLEVSAGMGVVIVGAEITGTLGPVSVTVGASAGLSARGSIAVRDADKDGKPELCGRVSYGPATTGVCVERWW